MAIEPPIFLLPAEIESRLNPGFLATFMRADLAGPGRSRAIIFWPAS